MNSFHQRAAMTPVGLSAVAAMLPDGWRKRLIELNNPRSRAGQIGFGGFYPIEIVSAEA